MSDDDLAEVIPLDTLSMTLFFEGDWLYIELFEGTEITLSKEWAMKMAKTILEWPDDIQA